MCNELPICCFDFENIRVTCPYCNNVNIFNRISDLNTTELVTSLDVICASCGRNLLLSGDIINPAYQMLFYKCYKYKEVKEYMASIITICTAYEMFFMFTLRFFLTVKPLKSVSSQYQRIKQNKELNDILEQKVAKYSFSKMLNEFIKLLIRNDSNPIITLDDSKSYITNMNGCSSNIDNIKQIENVGLRNQLIVLYKLKEKKLLIDSLRNKVVHKQGYRPSLEEVEREIKIAHNIIFKIVGILYLITDDVNLYYNVIENRDA